MPVGETHLASMRQGELESSHLGRYFVGDEDRLVAPTPESLPPEHEPSGLPGKA